MDLDDLPMSRRLGFAKEIDGVGQDPRENAPASIQRRATASSAMTVAGDAMPGYLVIVTADGSSPSPTSRAERSSADGGGATKQYDRATNAHFQPDKPGGANSKSLIALDLL
jgi:hypothetical protein